MNKRLAKEGLVTFTGGVSGAFIRFFSEVIVARTLSVAEFGTYGLLINIIAVVVHILSSGPRAVVQRFGAILHHSNHLSSCRKLFLRAFLFLSVLGPLLAVGMILYANQLANLFGNPDISQYIVYAALATPMMSTVYLLADSFRAIGAVKYFNVIQEVIPGALYVVTVLTIYFFGGVSLTTILMAYLASLVATLLIGARWYIIVTRDWSEVEELAPEFPDFLNHAMFSVLLYGAWIFRERVAVFIVSTKLGLDDVAYFLVALRFLLSISLIRAALNSLLMPRVSRLYHDKDSNELQLIYETITRWSFVSIFPIVMVISFFPGEIASLVYGDGYGRVVNAALALLMFQVFGLLAGNSSTALQMTGKSRQETMFLVISAFCIFITCYFLIDVFGLIGAVIGTFGTILIFDIMKAVYVWRTVGIVPVRWRQFMILGALIALWAFVCLLSHAHSLSLADRSMVLFVLGILVVTGLFRFYLIPTEREALKKGLLQR